MFFVLMAHPAYSVYMGHVDDSVGEPPHTRRKIVIDFNEVKPQDVPNSVKIAQKELRRHAKRDRLTYKGALIEKIKSSYDSEKIEDFYLTFRNIKSMQNLDTIEKALREIFIGQCSNYFLGVDFNLSNQASQDVKNKLNNLKRETKIKKKRCILPQNFKKKLLI